MKEFADSILESWNNREGTVNSTQDILKWVEERKSMLKVSVEQVPFSYDGFWHYDCKDGFIRNNNNSFFQLAGYQEIEEDQIILEQPIIIQNEIGYLGIICKYINGCLNFLMQAKIEPGNINAIQISPTLQATRSNFLRSHGGKKPCYLEYFTDSQKYTIVVDQVQSEQSSRFYKKRNRNIIILVDEDVPVLDSHKWMTLGQIKDLMKINNLVNMDTRTVISCLSFCVGEEESIKRAEQVFQEHTLLRSMLKTPDFDVIHRVFNQINDFKMFKRDKSRLVPLKSLKNWSLTEYDIVCKAPYDFKVIYCRIEIEDREVKYWEQPLIKALGVSVLGLFTCIDNGVRKYLARVKNELGCFDCAELGPTVQLGPSYPKELLDPVEKLFMQKLEEGGRLSVDVLLSEEGGRFYNEENRNVIIEIDKEELGQLPVGCFWMDYATISEMIRFPNCVNIQLRNLLALVDLN